MPNLNLFSKVVGRRRGQAAASCPGTAAPGSYVDLRAEMNVLVVLNTCPHPLDPAPSYAPKPVEAAALAVATRRAPTTSAAPRGPENERGFANTERYFL